MNFKINQKIMFELCNTTLSGKPCVNLPRWWWNKDKGATGRWATGKIEFLESDKISVSYQITNHIGTGHCFFPNKENDNYVEEQWQYDGYLQSGECDCGSKKIGYNTHSDWCTENLYNRRKDGL